MEEMEVREYGSTESSDVKLLEEDGRSCSETVNWIELNNSEGRKSTEKILSSPSFNSIFSSLLFFPFLLSKLFEAGKKLFDGISLNRKDLEAMNSRRETNST